MRTVPWQVSHNPPRNTPGYPAFGEKMARPSPEKLKRKRLSQRELWLEPVEPWNFMQKWVKIISRLFHSIERISWLKPIITEWAWENISKTQQKSAQGTISPTFVSPRLLGPQLVPGDDFAGDLHESAMRLLGRKSMRLIKFRDMKHRYLVMSSHISYQLAFLVTHFMLEQHSNLPFVLSIQKSQIGLHAKSTVFWMNLFDKSVALFEQFSSHRSLYIATVAYRRIARPTNPGILVHLSMAGRKGHLKQMQVI